MRTTSPGAFAPRAVAHVRQAQPDFVRADIFNRISIVAMFAVIIAIGSFGIFALARSQSNADVVAHRFENANDASEMLAALDREQSELHSQMRQPHGQPSQRFLQLGKGFDAAQLQIRRDGWPDTALMKNLAPSHAAFVADGDAILAALSAGDHAQATRIDTERARPKIIAIRHDLDVMSAALFSASVSAEGNGRRFSRRLQELIGSVTALGIGLMVGFAVLLRRYRRSAVASADATLAALEQAALTDALTELGNNRSFYEDFEREIARAKRHDHTLALALIDIDDFKSVNDKAGHSHGDAVLARVGEGLRTMRQEDRGYRIGGDEFALILVEAGPEAVALALGRLQDEIRDSGLGATVSIGYVNLSGEQLDAEAYELADTALYEAKRLGRNQTICFENVSATVNVFSPRKAETVRTMIEQGLVSTAFQPIWDMQSTRPLGFEALARPLPELGLSGPQEAFDVAERIRQLPELDMLCTRKTLEAAANLPDDSVIFLNYSPASLVHGGFDPTTFVATVRAAGLTPQQIVMELTERRIDDPTAVAKRVAALRALGVRIALDDTGSGHAGLEILSKVRFDFVKIDRGLIVEAMGSAEARGVLAGIIAIARETGSYLIAEGIETREMLDFVRKAHIPNFAGVRGIQGYLLGRPHLGPVDSRSLERHHDFLAARQLADVRVPGSVAAVAGVENSADGWLPSVKTLTFR
jgi:diguanylate cyclase (GGDEF)-like protein